MEIILKFAFLFVIYNQSLATTETNYKCDYELDLYNCINVNCNSQKSIKKLPTSLEQLIDYKIKENQLLCSLDLSETSITELSGQTLGNFYLFFNNLVKINANQTYTTLKLSFSHIESIKEIRLPFINLVLFIRDSDVNFVQAKCLSSNLKLELNILNVSINSINWFHLLESSKLKLLSMRNIQNLKSTNNDYFLLYPIASISDIKIYNSYLPILDDTFYLFKLLKHVEQLELTACSISFIKNSLFDKYSTFRHLKHLSLSSNNLNKISDQTFNGLNNLIYLDLDDNPIEYIHANAFNNLKKLKTLSINSNFNSNIRIIATMSSNPIWLFNILKSPNRDLKEIHFKTNKLLKNNFCLLNTIIQNMNTVNENLRIKYLQQSNNSETDFDDIVRSNRYLKLFSQQELDYKYENFLNDKIVYCSIYFVCKYAQDYSSLLINAWNIEYFKVCSNIMIVKDVDYLCALEHKLNECKNYYGGKNLLEFTKTFKKRS